MFKVELISSILSCSAHHGWLEGEGWMPWHVLGTAWAECIGLGVRYRLENMTLDSSSTLSKFQSSQKPNLKEVLERLNGIYMWKIVTTFSMNNGGQKKKKVEFESICKANWLGKLFWLPFTRQPDYIGWSTTALRFKKSTKAACIYVTAQFWEDRCEILKHWRITYSG